MSHRAELPAVTTYLLSPGQAAAGREKVRVGITHPSLPVEPAEGGPDLQWPPPCLDGRTGQQKPADVAHPVTDPELVLL